MSLINLLTLLVVCVLFPYHVDAASTSSCSNSTSATLRTVGYYAGWATARKCDRVYPEEINAAGYTHINFAYSYIDPKTFSVASVSNSDYDLYDRLTSLRQLNPGLQVWLSLGGWDMNTLGQPTATTFSTLVSSQTNWKPFSTSLLEIMQAYAFDGVDFDWQYPVAPDRGGSAEDGDNYGDFMNYMRTTLDATGFSYGLSMTVPTAQYYLKAYDLASFAPYVDWFNLIAYDYDGVWNSPAVASPGPFIRPLSNLTETDQALTSFWLANVHPAKINLGLGFYGRSFTIPNNDCLVSGCPISGPGVPGNCTDTDGFLSYDEVLAELNQGATVSYFPDVSIAAAIYGGNQWVSFETAQSLYEKVNYANQHCLGGMMVWSVDLDRGGHAMSELSESTAQLNRSATAPFLDDFVSQCKWTDCIDGTQTCPGVGGPKSGPCVADCPSGSTTQWVSSGAGVCGGDGSSFRRFCCPNDAPTTCKIQHGQDHFCNGRCTGDQVRIGSTTTGCLIGHDEVCCSRSASVAAQEQCEWSTTCTAGGTCPNNRPNLIGSSMTGDGGKPCTGSETYTLCCSNPTPYTNCKWNRGPFGGNSCQGTCSQGQTIVASASDYCTTGTQVLCCDGSTEVAYVAQFDLQLATFIQHPSCPANELRPNPGESPVLSPNGSYTGLDWKRDADELVKRDYNSFGGAAEIALLAAAIYGTSHRSLDLQNSWDNLAGPTFLRTDELRDYLDTYNNNDPNANLEQALCAWNTARQNLRDLSSASTQVCIPLYARVNTTSPATKRSLDKRVFNPNLLTDQPTTGGSSAINTGALLDQILNTPNVPLLYARPIRYHNEMFLEVAFDIRTTPELQQLPEDIFAVFHFHIVDMVEPDNHPNDPNNWVPRVQRVNVFHGQTVYNANPDDADNPFEWRVYNHGGPGNDEGAQGENERAILVNCPEDELWAPGTGTETEDLIINDFGDYLASLGILRGDTPFHMWSMNRQRWYWEQRRPEWDYPNVGTTNAQGQVTNAAADMRPLARGGVHDWPEAVFEANPDDTGDTSAGDGSGAIPRAKYM